MYFELVSSKRVYHIKLLWQSLINIVIADLFISCWLIGIRGCSGRGTMLMKTVCVFSFITNVHVLYCDVSDVNWEGGRGFILNVF